MTGPALNCSYLASTSAVETVRITCKSFREAAHCIAAEKHKSRGPHYCTCPSHLPTNAIASGVAPQVWRHPQTAHPIDPEQAASRERQHDESRIANPQTVLVGRKRG